MPRPRQVKATGKDEDGNITLLKGGFGRVTKAQAIHDIERGNAKYAVGDASVIVVNGQSRKHLRTQPDGKKRNNLDELPS